jgi:hypothetical protein
MGRLDYLLRDQFDDDAVQADLDMQTLTQMQMADDIHAMRTGAADRPSLTRGTPRSSGSEGHATTGWRNRGAFFWIMLIIMIYWFLLRPLGL